MRHSGPFDNAHLIMGHKIYTEIYDNPERVHRLLEIISDTYIKFTKVQKEIIGESGSVHCHMDIKAPGAVRVCDDASINISADSYREFSKPYNERVLSECGGGWIHYCGNGKQIFPEVISSKNLRGINFGNPELQDINEIYKEASNRNVAVLSWLGDVPNNAKTGITLLRNSNSLESARQLVANHVAHS